jgi:hypothetical protein
MHLATRNGAARHSPVHPPSSLSGMFWRLFSFQEWLGSTESSFIQSRGSRRVPIDCHSIVPGYPKTVGIVEIVAFGAESSHVCTLMQPHLPASLLDY